MYLFSYKVAKIADKIINAMLISRTRSNWIETLSRRVTQFLIPYMQQLVIIMAINNIARLALVYRRTSWRASCFGNYTHERAVYSPFCRVTLRLNIHTYIGIFFSSVENLSVDDARAYPIVSRRIDYLPFSERGGRIPENAHASTDSRSRNTAVSSSACCQ